LTKNRYKK